MRLLAALLALVCAVPSFAEDWVGRIKGLDRGKEYNLRFNENGSVTVVPLDVVTVGGGPTTPPNPPVDPLPAPTQLSTAVEQLTNVTLVGGASKTTGAAIASIYSLAAKEVAEGRLDPAKAFDFTSSATTTILGFQADGAKWAKFRTDLSALITPQPQTTKDEVVSLMKQIAAGMDKATGFNSSPGSLRAIVDSTPADRERMGIFDGIDIAKIIELVKLILSLLALFKGGG